MFLLLLFSSCNTYYYAQVAPVSREKVKVENNYMQVTKDSIYITYNFLSEYYPVEITIENRTSHPILINWEESGMILNGVMHTYANTNSPIRITGSSWETSSHSSSLSNSNMNGVVKNELLATFLPPMSSKTYYPKQIAKIPIDKIDKKLYEKRKVFLNDNLESLPIYSPREGDSKIKFRSYITASIPSLNQKIIFDDEFYVSALFHSGYKIPNIQQMFTQNLHFPAFKMGSPMVYIKSNNTLKAIGYSLLLGGLAGGMGAILPDTQTPTDQQSR